MSHLLPKFVSQAAHRFHRAESSPLSNDDVGNGAGGIRAANREALLCQVKREVKQLMEESVARKFIHEESAVIAQLCSGVESCLLYGLKRQSLLPGVFQENSTLALLHRVAKSFQPAKHVTDRLAVDIANSVASANQRRATTPSLPKYQWIRVALLEKRLAKIVEHLVEQSRLYYETESIVADPCDGPLLASLLVGPCALDYTKAKSMSYAFKERSTEELLQRHLVASPMKSSPGSPRTNRTTSLRVLRHFYGGGLGGADLWAAGSSSAMTVQTDLSTAALLYGKNGVVSQAASQGSASPGYLSLHSTQTGLVVKWTPNSIMLGGGGSGGGCGGGEVSADGSTPPPSPSSMADETLASPATGTGGDDSSSSPSELESGFNEQIRPDSAEISRSSSSDAAFVIQVEEMVHIHCHTGQAEGGGGGGGGGSLVFVARDGTQQPPLHFPTAGGGGHLLQFLTSLENGLAPTGWLDPPLWTQRGRKAPQDRQGSKRKSLFADSFLAGLLATSSKIIPVGSGLPNSDVADALAEDELNNGEVNTDFVFRIVLRGGGFSFESADSSTGLQLAWQREDGSRRNSRPLNSPLMKRQQPQRQESIQQLCSSMRRQILSRAFNGWLSHVRQNRLIRDYLANLLDAGPEGGAGRPEDFPVGLTTEIWERGRPEEVYRAIYWGGCRPEMRKKVWPLMLGFHPWGSTESERRALDQAAQVRFENLLSEWGPVDVIVRENDKELVINARDVLRRKLEAVEASSTMSKQQQQQQQRRSKRPNNRRLPDPPPQPPSLFCDEASPADAADGEDRDKHLGVETGGAYSRLSTSRESLASPASPASNGGVYSAELIKTVTENWHRIDKDVTRCDRHITFFSDDEHLDKLRNIMCCYVWENLQVGYIQGFCDLLAPLLIVLEDEGLTLGCFERLMHRMVSNFPTDDAEIREASLVADPAVEAADSEGIGSSGQHRSLMNQQLANLSAALQVIDPQLHEHIVRKGEQERTGVSQQQQQQSAQLHQLHMHFCFCFRWLLLDFKREICYNDVFRVWETVWAASHLVSSHFSIFIAIALLQEYRGFIMENDMNLADVTMLYIDMAERHSAVNLLNRARELINQLAKLLESQG